jgi:hypothetical protein
MKAFSLIGLIILFYLTSCEKANENNLDNLTRIDFNELFNDSIPPCLVGINEIVIKNHEDYNTIKISHAPPGEYEDFYGNGQRLSFKLSYQPLDSDFDGKIGPNDLVIYVKDQPIISNIDGNEIIVSSNPFRIVDDSILIFSDESPYTVIYKIHYTSVFQVNEINGEVTFNNAPLAGSHISICAVMKLYEVYNNRSCTFDDFNLTDKIIIGNSVYGNGCFMGFDIELYLDTVKRDLIYKAKIKIADTDYGCPEIFISDTKWILIENIQEDYNVKFKYDTLRTNY